MEREMGAINKNMTAEKGLAIVQKKTREDWGAVRKMGLALLPQWMGVQIWGTLGFF
jgi:hypothetical protein